MKFVIGPRFTEVFSKLKKNMSACVSICPSVCPPARPPVCLSVCPSVHPPIRPSVRLFIKVLYFSSELDTDDEVRDRATFYRSVLEAKEKHVRLSVCLSVRPSVRFVL